MASPIKHLGLMQGQFASSRDVQPSSKTAAPEYSSEMEPRAWLSLASLIRLSLVFFWKVLVFRRIPGSAGNNEEKLDAYEEQSSLQKIKASSCSSSATGIDVPFQGFLQNSWKSTHKTICTRRTDGKQKSYNMEVEKMEAAVERRFGNPLKRTFSRPRMIDLMTTLARPDHSITWNVDDRAIMTNDVMTVNYSSEISCIDVASSIRENTHPRASDLRYRWTCEQCLEGNARPQRRENGVINICTKCIQLGFLCLIIISNISVLRVTASSSFLLNFHRLFFYLFYGGELRYCLYFKDRFFYNLYKVLMMEMSYYVFLLDKNGSILE